MKNLKGNYKIFIFISLTFSLFVYAAPWHPDTHWANQENSNFSEDLKEEYRKSRKYFRYDFVNWPAYFFNPKLTASTSKRRSQLQMSVLLLTADEELRWGTEKPPHPELYPALAELINTPRPMIKRDYEMAYNNKDYQNYRWIHNSIAYLLLAIKGSHKYSNYEALKDLGHIDFLKDPNNERILSFVEEEIQPKEDFSIDYKNHWLRSAIALTIGELGLNNPEINQVLIDILENPDEDDLLRYYSAWAIGKIQPEDPEVHQALTDALEELNAPLHTAVSWAIKQLEP